MLIVACKIKNENIPLAGVRPLILVILSNRAVPPSLILASRRSRRRRADLCAADSSGADIILLFCSLSRVADGQNCRSDDWSVLRCRLAHGSARRKQQLSLFFRMRVGSGDSSC